MASYREPLFDDDLPDLLIEPRPEPEPKTQAPNPEPEPMQKAIAITHPVNVAIPASTPREIAAKGFSECDGISEADRLLQSIVLLARKEPPNKGALRFMIARFSNEHGLGF
jgi:hypothetical protein